MLKDIFLEVARRVDGAALVREALPTLTDLQGAGPVHVLAVGKVAFPMFEGLKEALGPQGLGRALLVAPATRFPSDPQLPPGAEALVSDHPTPSARSVAAGAAARAFVAALGPSERLCVLISGGGSAALASPAPGLAFEDKRAALTAVARAGATIGELNAVRKHLSAVKGGRLALATRARTVVLALSDVVGNDPGTIASGPFAADTTTFADALGIVKRLVPAAPPAVLAHLERGAAGELEETPKPGDTRLAHVDFRLLAGPARVSEEARRIAAHRGCRTEVLSRDTEDPVSSLAAAYGARARSAAAEVGPERLFIGNGEPSIVVTGNGKGGRATHLALTVAREIDGLTGVSFLAAGTDDRDGSSSASGAVVDGTTWRRARASGLDPEGALARCDSETPLEALGCLVRGPGSSNLLDLHLLHVASARSTQ